MQYFTILLKSYVQFPSMFDTRTSYEFFMQVSSVKLIICVRVCSLCLNASPGLLKKGAAKQSS